MESKKESTIGTFEAGRDGGGHLRSAKNNYRKRSQDPIVARGLARSLHIRGGETIEYILQGKGNRAPTLRIDDVISVDGLKADERGELTPFEDLTAIDPREPLRFETPGGPTSMRVIDLMCPIGLGQRGLIVAPPRTGKTVLLQHMAAGVAANYPDVYMMVLLIDERPEEVTDMRRTVHGEVVASSNDNDVADHIRIARLMNEKARRMVECGKDVVVLLDSLTRLGRAFNNGLAGNRRIMSGGLDARALIEPKAIFGAARNAEEGGSLTIIATCLIETGSRMDEVIFNEFKGTGNMEIMLCRDMANRRLWPAIDLNGSGTRKEELLLTPSALEVSHQLRRQLIDHGSVRSMEMLLDTLSKYESNARFTADVISRS